MENGLYYKNLPKSKVSFLIFVFVGVYIIGVFGNQVKLIGSDYPTSNQIGTGDAYYSSDSTSNYSNYKGGQSIVYWYKWNPSGSADWSSSVFVTTNLNTIYLNNLGQSWSNLIATHSWKVGEISYDNVFNSPVQTVYNNEVGTNSTSTTYSAKIGLMYVSDYGYAASNSNWTTALYNYDTSTNTNNNWMYLGLDEWTISPRSGDSTALFKVDVTGYLRGLGEELWYYYVVRPCFYLNSDVEYASGSGTISDPIRIKID